MNFNVEEDIPTFDKVNALCNWPGVHYGMPAPSQKTIDAAMLWLHELYCYANNIGQWSEPNVTVSEDADVVFEWWHNKRKLTVYVSSEGTEYINAWGSDIFNEMEDGNADDAQSRRNVWAWLMG